MAKATAGGWLFKEEPTCYSYADLERDGETTWSGVTNALAVKNLRSVKPGDRVLFYQTGKDKAVVGEMQATSEPADDPKNPKSAVLRLKPVKRWPRPVTLAEIKADPFFADWDLVRISRLSVMRVSPDQWRRLEAMSES